MAKTTDELFAEATEADYEISEPVVLAASDTEEEFQFRIDEHLRTIAIPEKGVVAGVEGDLNVNIARFTMVRYYHGRDLSKLSARINYRNANGQVNYYNVSDAAVSGDSIVFSWEYAADVTQYKGNVQFVVYLFSATNAVLKQRFFTTLGTLEVLEGLEVDSSIPVSEQTDILLHLKKDLSAYAEEVKKSLPADYTAMTEQVSSLKEDISTITSKKLSENLFDEVWEIGGINSLGKDNNSATSQLRTDFIGVDVSNGLGIWRESNSPCLFQMFAYNEEDSFLGSYRFFEAENSSNFVFKDKSFAGFHAGTKKIRLVTDNLSIGKVQVQYSNTFTKYMPIGTYECDGVVPEAVKKVKLSEQTNDCNFVTAFATEELDDRMIKLEKETEFRWQPFDRGKVVFMTDDTLSDIGVITSLLMNTYGFPMSYACITDKLENDVDENDNGYEKVIDVLLASQSFGGEVFSHSINSDDWSTNKSTNGGYDGAIPMEESERRLRKSKEVLHSYGIKCNGFISPRGSDLFGYGEQVAKYYRYAYYQGNDIPQIYHFSRINIKQMSLIDLKEKIDKCAEEKTLLVLMCHKVADTNGEGYGVYSNGFSIDDFKAIMDYLKWGNDEAKEKQRTDIEVTSMKSIYDAYASMDVQGLETLKNVTTIEKKSDNFYDGRYRKNLNVLPNGDFEVDGYWATYPLQLAGELYVTYFSNNTMYPIPSAKVVGFSGSERELIDVDSNGKFYANAKYDTITISFSSITVFPPQAIMISMYKPSEYIPYSEPQLLPIISRSEFDDLKRNVPLFNYVEVKSKNIYDGKYERPLNLMADGTKWTNNQEYWTTMYISVQYGDVLRFYLGQNTFAPYRVIAFNESKTILGELEKNSVTTVNIENTACIRIVFPSWTTYKPEMVMITCNYEPFGFMPYHASRKVYGITTGLPHYKMAVLGDSIMSEQKTGIGTCVSELLGCDLVGNFAVGNATVSDWHAEGINETEESVELLPNAPSNKNVLSNQVRRLMQHTTELGKQITWTVDDVDYSISTGVGLGYVDDAPDIILIALGTNDGMNSTHTDYTDDSESVIRQNYADLNRNSFSSAYRWAIETLRSQYPDAYIFCTSPINSKYYDGNHGYDAKIIKAKMIKTIADFESVYYIDGFHESGFSIQVAKNHGDGVHPDYIWRDKIAKFFANEIKTRIN